MKLEFLETVMLDKDTPYVKQRAFPEMK